MFRLFGTKKHPKGPGFNRARQLEYDFSGTKFRFKAPPHSDTTYSARLGKSKVNLYDPSMYITREEPEGSLPFLSGGYSETWTFHGLPVIHGALGRLVLGFGVHKLLETDTRSLFYKPGFEEVHLEYIDRVYGPANFEERFYRAPLDWRIYKINGIEWFNYSLREVGSGNQSVEFSAPLADRYMLNIGFNLDDYSQSGACSDVFEALMEPIISSFQIEYSAESQRQKAEAEAKWPDMRYSEHVPERAWPEFEERQESEEARKDREIKALLNKSRRPI